MSMTYGTFWRRDSVRVIWHVLKAGLNSEVVYQLCLFSRKLVFQL